MSRNEDVLRAVAGAADRRDELVRVALTTGEELDDIRRSKIWTRIEDRLDDRAPAPWRWLLAGGASALAIAAMVALIATRGHGPADGLVAPADATLSLRLGHAKAALVGPARLDVVEVSDRSTTVALKSGRFLGDFEGGHGRSLRIEAPGAVIEVVGTLFAVDALGAKTCVSVAHGRVKMTTFTHVLFVDGGTSACSDSLATRAIASDVGEALAHHAAALAIAEPAIGRDEPGLGPSSAPAPSLAPATKAASAGAIPAKPTQTRAPSAARAPATATPTPPPAPAPSPARASAPTTAASETPAAGLGRDPAPSAPPAAPPPRPVTADDLYRSAEAALAKHDLAAADRALAKIVDDLPTSSLVDQALYERARIAYERHAYTDAHHDLARLATLGTSPLLEPGAYLACRVAIASNDATADACLATYRSTYPHSPHDLEVLGLLVDRAFRAGGCTRAAPLVDELTRLYQATTLARGWRERCP